MCDHIQIVIDNAYVDSQKKDNRDVNQKSEPSTEHDGNHDGSHDGSHDDPTRRISVYDNYILSRFITIV